MAHYPDDFLNRLHFIWGPGFLSPGGPDEVREIVRGLDSNDALVLDIGCGTGGPAIVLAPVAAVEHAPITQRCRDHDRGPPRRTAQPAL